jgi:uncharacterized repeat protein (TIGR01451 family)
MQKITLQYFFNKYFLLIVFSITATHISIAQTPPNDQIQNAKNIISIPFVDINVRTQNATPASFGDIGSCPLGTFNLTRVYYRFVPQTDVSMRIEITNGNPSSSFVIVTRSSVSNATSDNNLYLEDSSQCTNATFTEYSFTAGEVYYILVSNPSSATTVMFYELGTDMAINLPEGNFKNALLNDNVVLNDVSLNDAQGLTYGAVFSGDNTSVDFNGDGVIQTFEALAVTGLNLQSKNITDLTGIDNFSNLYFLNIRNNNIGTLSTLQNLNLKFLDCIFNPLPASVDFSLFPELEILLCANTQLTSIDVSQNTLLRGLNSAAISNSNLATLDITNNTSLECLWHGFTPITSIDLSNNINLKFLRMSQSSNLSTLDVSQNILLEELELNNCAFQSIDVTNNTALNYFTFRGNQVSTIDLSQNALLERLICGRNQFTQLDVTQNSLLRYLDFAENQISSIDLTQNISLQHVACYDNLLTTLDLSQNIELGNPGISFYGVDCSRNLLTSLDLSNNINLRGINVSDNYYLETLNIKNGNNTLINTNYFSTEGCTNLQTICVDDIGYATVNLTNVEPQSIFVEDCNATTVNYNILAGTVTLDLDANGCDLSDIRIPNIMVQTTDGTDTFSTFTNANGEFAIDVLENTYDSSLVNIPSYFTYSPQIALTTFIGYNNTEVNNFCIFSSQTNIDDVSVTLLPINEARPGFDARYELVYQNLSIQSMTGTITLQFDDSMQNFVSASPSATSVTSNTLTFNYSNLLPFESRVIEIVMNTNPPPTVNGDDVLNFTAQILPNTNDVNINNNTYNLAQTVVNSFDPNDKQVLQGSQITIDETGEYLDYVIRFQNTGTASAINVVITDELSDKLDWSTLQPTSSSDDYRVRISNGNFVEFIYENINLPSNMIDEPNSIGFIAYKIKPKNNVAVGDIITGEAKIYFDYNAPIITNEVSTEIVQPLSVTEFDTNSIAMFPNPTKGMVTIQSDSVIKHVTIIDMNGRKLDSKEFSNSSTECQLATNNLSAGMYFVKIETSSGTLIQKLIKH